MFLFIYLLFYFNGFFILINSSFYFSKDKDLNITAIHTFFNPTRSFILSLFFLIYLFSFSGLPIFLGFLAKASLAFSFISGWAFWVFFFSSLINTLSFFYTLRLVRIIFFDLIFESFFSFTNESWDFFKIVNFSSISSGLIIFIVFFLFFFCYFFFNIFFL